MAIRAEVTPILPTPVVGVLGVLDDVRPVADRSGAEPGETLYLLGDTRDEFDGSIGRSPPTIWGKPLPVVDLVGEKLLAEVWCRPPATDCLGRPRPRRGRTDTGRRRSRAGRRDRVPIGAARRLRHRRRRVCPVVLGVGGTCAGGGAAHRGKPIPGRCARRVDCLPPGSGCRTAVRSMLRCRDSSP